MEKYDINQYDHINTVLFEALIGDESFDQLLKISANILGNPIIVIDACYRVVGYSEMDDIYDSLWVENISLGYCSYDFITQVNMLQSVKTGKNSENAYEVLCEDSNYARLVCKMKSNGNFLGNVILLACKKDLEPKDYQILTTVSKVLSMKMNTKTYHVFHRNKNMIRQDFLYDLLNNRIKSKEEMKNRLKIMDFKLENDICILVFDVEGCVQRSDISLILKEKFNRIKDDLEYSIYYENYIVILYSEAKLTRLLQKIISFISENNIYVGISRTFSDLFQCSKYYLQALNTINIGKRIYPMKNVIYYYEVQNYSFLNYLDKDCDADDYCHPALQKLREYDRVHNSDLYDILYVFIQNGGSIQKTAENFFVHRNTVRYKINKIKELIAIDFTDISQLSNLFISYSINKYLEYEKGDRVGIK